MLHVPDDMYVLQACLCRELSRALEGRRVAGRSAAGGGCFGRPVSTGLPLKSTMGFVSRAAVDGLAALPREDAHSKMPPIAND